MKHSIVFHLIRLGKTIQKSTNFKSPPPALSYSQAAAILAIFLEDKMTQNDIATRLHLEPASVVTLIDELERLKLVKRELQNDDRRKYFIKLTQKGFEKAKEKGKAVGEHLGRHPGKYMAGAAAGGAAGGYLAGKHKE